MLSLAAFAACLVAACAASVDQHIVSGEIATPHRFPWQLSLQTSGHICGAVLVTPEFAITAAHCVNQNQPWSYRLFCGGHRIRESESYRQSRTVSAITNHPQYNPNSNRPAFPNDISVVKLSSPFNLDSRCAVAKLGEPDNTYGGRKAWISGWGRLYGNGPAPNQLKKGNVDILTTQDCANRWGTTVDSNVHLCIKDIGNQVYGACNGDSGGPVQTEDDDTVVGLASFVASGCLVQHPSVYARVSTYRSWINSTMNAM